MLKKINYLYKWQLENCAIIGLKNLAEQLQFDYVLTAHHADDNLETFLINLSRGTGLDGLSGIPVINDKLVRPLLLFSREAIETYAKDNNLKWREDSSNISTKYLRNKLRHDVIPILKEINPQLLQNFNKTQAYLKNSKLIIEDRIEDVFTDIVNQTDSQSISFDISKIKKLSKPKAYLFEFLKDYNFTEWDDVENLLDAQSGKQVFSNTHRLLKDRTFLLLTEITSESYKPIKILNLDNKIETPFGALIFNKIDSIVENLSNTVYVDKDKLNFPLTIRKWEEGDVFYPLGMIGKKKLSKYFKDEKISLFDKENVWVLCSGKDIVWVINRRADNRFKVTEATKHILKIELK